MAARGRPKEYTEVVRCPDPLHRGSSTSVSRTRETKTGVRRIYRCQPLTGKAHCFTLVIAETKPVAVAPQGGKPECGLHESSHVVRDGSYGKRSPLRRQRYRCYPDPKDKKVWHSFVLDLARQHVHVTGETCSECEELRGVHRGDPAVARQHSWPAKIVARGLDMLASGSSYVEVSRWALRAEAAAVEEVEQARKAAEEQHQAEHQAIARLLSAFAEKQSRAAAKGGVAGAAGDVATDTNDDGAGVGADAGGVGVPSTG